MSTALRPPLVSPLLLLLVRRAVATAIANGADQESILAHLRPSGTDPDRTAVNWTTFWPESTRLSLRSSIAAIPSKPVTDTAQPDAIAAALADWRLENGAQASLPRAGLLVADAIILPWSKSGQAHHDRTLVAHAIRAKAANQQVWMHIANRDLSAIAVPSAVRDGMRLGWSWLLEPPPLDTSQHHSPRTDPKLLAYAKSISDWGDAILGDPAADQWVWPWTDLMEGDLSTRILLVKPSPGRSPPHGWPADRFGWNKPAFGALTSILVRRANAWFGEHAVMDDLLLGCAFGDCQV